MIDRQLLDLEVQLYHYETSYFEKYPNGNLIKGFDSAVGSTAANAPLANTSQTFPGAARLPDEDRLFSNSSLTFQKVKFKFKSNYFDFLILEFFSRLWH